MTRNTMTVVVLTIMACLFSPCIANANVPFQVPVPNTVTMIDLGSSMCTPCQRMMPILSELQMQYLGRVAIVYIDVDEYEGMDKQFGARTVPTQIFYDQTGKEVYRHEGFFSKESIVNVFSQIGLPPVMTVPQGNGAMAVAPYPIQAVPYQPVYPATTPQRGNPGAASVPPGYAYPPAQAPQARVQAPPVRTPQVQVQAAPSQDLVNQYATGPVITPTGLLTPGVVNLLYFEVNAQNPQQNTANVFSQVEQQYRGKVAVMAVDAGLNQGLAGSLGVQSTPMLIIYGAQGQEILRHPGAPSLAEMQNVLSRIIGR